MKVSSSEATNYFPFIVLFLSPTRKRPKLSCGHAMAEFFSKSNVQNLFSILLSLMRMAVLKFAAILESKPPPSSLIKTNKKENGKEFNF